MTKKSLLVTWAACAASVIGLLMIESRGHVEVVERRLNDMPLELGDWRGEDRQFDDKVYQVLKADENLLRLYARAPSEEIWLYIGYYGTEKGGRTGHMPIYCYPGSGWDIESQGQELLTDAQGKRVAVKTLLVKRGDVKRLAYWWIHADREKVLTSGLQMNLNRFRRRILDNRDDGAFVRISVTLDPQAPERSRALLTEFSNQVLQSLPHYWPVEKEVKS